MAKAAVKCPRVLAVADTALSSRLIEYAGGSGWSHWANVLSDGTVLDARSDRTYAPPGWDCGNGVRVGADGRVPAGVRLRPHGYLDSVKKWMLIELPCEGVHQYNMWEAAGREQLGKPYDSDAIWDFADGSLYDRNWRDHSAWFCDELGAWMMEEARLVQPVPLPIYKFNPGSALNLVLGMKGYRVIATRGC